MSGRAPVPVLAVGNPSRGDDATGPELAARVEAERVPGVEVISEFQLQVENALDLVGRERVVFVDAGTGTPAPFELCRVEAEADFLHTSAWKRRRISCTPRTPCRRRRCSRPTGG